MTETAVTVIKQGFVLPDEGQFRQDFKSITRFQAIVQQELIDGTDYGEIPGTKKKTLLKPGAEKIAKLLGLSDRYEVTEKIEDWTKPLFYYQIKCTLTHEASGMLVSEGLGSCNSMEDKYRYRWLWPNEVPANVDKSKLVPRKLKSGALQYRTDNEEIYTIVNTILKMAKKRALVDASLSAGRLSNVFTQDLEDMAKDADADDTPDETEKPAPKESKLGNCPDCGSPLAQRSGKFGDFIACTGYPKCKYKPPKEKDTPIETVGDSEKSPVAASQGETGTVEPPAEEMDWNTFEKMTEELARKIWGDEWQSKFKAWGIERKYLVKSRRDIKSGKRNEVIDLLTQMADLS